LQSRVLPRSIIQTFTGVGLRSEPIGVGQKMRIGRHPWNRSTKSSCPVGPTSQAALQQDHRRHLYSDQPNLRASQALGHPPANRSERRLLARGARRPRLPSVTGSILGWQSSRPRGLRTMAKVSRRTRGPALSAAEADQSYEATHGARREYVRTLRRSSLWTRTATSMTPPRPAPCG
jgi:hypothetical protein